MLAVSLDNGSQIQVHSALNFRGIRKILKTSAMGLMGGDLHWPDIGTLPIIQMKVEEYVSLQGHMVLLTEAIVLTNFNNVGIKN